MTSLFRSRQSPEELGSGGKILRGRRVAPSASPYLLPQRLTPPPPPPPPAHSRNPNWLSGLISGTGKLISSVFGSDGNSPSSSSSSGYSSNEEIISTSEEDEDIAELLEIIKGGNEAKLIGNHMKASSDIIPKSESKLAIEQLLMQETFSRDECMKLREIIHSRVVEYPSPEAGGDETQEIPNYTTGRASSFLGARTRDLRSTAVMEAKKWLDEKKSASSSNAILDHGPYTLNKDTFQKGIEGEVGSPVDMAKSFMRSLAPWQSPSLYSIGLKTLPSSGRHLYKDETSYATTIHSLPSSKVLKRNYLAIGPWDTLDEIRRVRLNSIDSKSEIPNCRQIVRSTCLSDHTTTKISSATEKIEMRAEGNCTIGALSEPLIAGELNNNSLMPTILVPCHSKTGSETKLSDPDNHTLDENLDVEVPSPAKEQISSFSVPLESNVLASTPVKHDGDHLSEASIVPPEEIKSVTPSPPAKPNTNSDIESLSEAGLGPSSSNADEPATPTPEGICELLSEAAVDVPVNVAKITADKSQNGTGTKSTEHLLTQPQPRRSARGRKAVVRPKRGRGKSK